MMQYCQANARTIKLASILCNVELEDYRAAAFKAWSKYHAGANSACYWFVTEGKWSSWALVRFAYKATTMPKDAIRSETRHSSSEDTWGREGDLKCLWGKLPTKCASKCAAPSIPLTCALAFLQFEPCFPEVRGQVEVNWGVSSTHSGTVRCDVLWCIIRCGGWVFSTATSFGGLVT